MYKGVNKGGFSFWMFRLHVPVNDGTTYQTARLHKHNNYML